MNCNLKRRLFHSLNPVLRTEFASFKAVPFSRSLNFPFPTSAPKLASNPQICILLIIQALKRLQVWGIRFVGWGGAKAGGFADVVEDSSPTICHICAASETQMLSKTDREITLHLIDALTARVGMSLICGQHTVLQLPAPAPCPAEWGGGRGCVLVPILQHACDVSAEPCSQLESSLLI